ncbi:MAG: AraC family transcriptional regulator [Proteobacteria bacterium]|nr:AraC family transcriptional regulator [Pseudomonadota bacterium]
MDAPCSFDLHRRKPGPQLAGLVAGLSGYRETARGLYGMRQTAPLLIPLIVSFGTPFSIALGRAPNPADRQENFAAGLWAGPVHIQSDGAAECVQIDFTPLGAYRFFGGAVAELAGRMVDLEDVLGRDARRLRERLAAGDCWPARFDLVEDFVARRIAYRPSPEIVFAYRTLARAGGNARVDAVAREIGWSRKHLVGRFQAEIGLGPKSVARMMRFHRAREMARTGSVGSWAMIAADCGYADQAHLAREFTAFAGESPTTWARREAQMDDRLRDII